MTQALIDALFNGLSNSSILILVALGLAIMFGVMGVINMAHGEMLMLGAYTAYVCTAPTALPTMLQNLGLNLDNLIGKFADDPKIHFFRDHLYARTGYGLNLYWAIPISFVVVGLVGYLLEVCLIRFLYGRPLDTLLATWGVGLIFQQGTRLLFGADLKPLDLPETMRHSWTVPWHGQELTFPYYRWFILGFTALCLLIVYVWFFKTPSGLKIRAVTQNRPMAAAMGISTRRVDSLTFAFGAGLAGAAGCIVGHLYVVNPDMGTSYIVDAFMVVILGGMGHLSGTVLAGAIIGTTTSLLAKLYGNAFAEVFPRAISEVNQQMARVTVLLVVIGVIMVRPTGLFRTRGRVYD
jgi:urea transport system permease protein